MLHGRTDVQVDSPAESRMARDRANAVRDYLVAAGVDVSRIRATYQPTGDPAADNTSSGHPIIIPTPLLPCHQINPEGGP